MTLADAIAVLNRHRHRGRGDWYDWGGDAAAGDNDPYNVLSAFEAVAVAERYARGDSPSSQPPSPATTAATLQSH